MGVTDWEGVHVGRVYGRADVVVVVGECCVYSEGCRAVAGATAREFFGDRFDTAQFAALADEATGTISAARVRGLLTPDGAGMAPGGGGGSFPAELVVWFSALELSEGKLADVLAFICSEDMGFTAVEELKELDDEDVAAIDARLPKAKRKKFKAPKLHRKENPEKNESKKEKKKEKKERKKKEKKGGRSGVSCPSPAVSETRLAFEREMQQLCERREAGTASISAAEAADEARATAVDNIQMLRGVNDTTTEMANNAMDFAAMAKQLRQGQQTS